MRRFAPLSIAALASVATAQANGPQVLSWLDRELLKRIQVTGYRQFGFHAHDVDGDREAFNSLTYFGQGGRKFTDTGAVNFVGRQVLGLFDFDVTLTDNRYQDPQAQRIALNYDKGPIRVQAGDITASLTNTNPYASFSRNVRGGTVHLRSGPFSASVLRTETKASARTLSFQGTNSSGPYYLQSSQLVNGSETILLDGQAMTIGVDYVIDYEVGAITFINRIIPPTATITVTYEAFDFNSARGTITGAGASYDLGKYGRVGVTAIEENSRASGTLSSRIEQFEGFGAPSTPYFLQFEPMNTAGFPTRIRLDGILQVENVDYVFDTNNKSVFYFRRFVPATSIIEVAYFPKPTSLAEGDRRVVGFDYRIPINSRGAITYAQATGSLRNDVNPLEGTARGIRVSYETGGVTLRAGVQDIPESFVAPESRGFNRNERSSDIGIKVARQGIVYDFSHRNASITSRDFDNLGGVSFVRAREAVTRLGLSHTAVKPTELSWNLDHTRLGVKRFKTQTDLDTTSAFASHSTGRLTSRYGLQNQIGRVYNWQEDKRLNMQSIRMDTDYRAGQGWNLGSRLGITRSRYDGESGTGHDISLTGVYRPNDRFSLDLGVTDSRAGQVSTLAGFTGAYGVGYDGNGFSSGLIGAGPISGSSDLQLIQAHTRWQALSNLALDARAYKARTSGGVSSNTDTTAFGLGLDWQIRGGSTFSLSIDRSQTSYIGSNFKSTATTFDANLAGRLGRRWAYRGGLGVLFTEGGEFSQNSLYMDGSLTYRLDPRSNLSARMTYGKTTGYYPQQESFLGVFYEYQLYRNVSLIGSYKWRNVANLDPLFTSGAYRSRGFDIEISFNFGS